MENLFLAFVLSCFIVDTSVFIESTGTWITGTWTVHVQCNVTRLHGIQIKLVL